MRRVVALFSKKAFRERSTSPKLRRWEIRRSSRLGGREEIISRAVLETYFVDGPQGYPLQLPLQAMRAENIPRRWNSIPSGTVYFQRYFEPSPEHDRALSSREEKIILQAVSLYQRSAESIKHSTNIPSE